MTVNTKELRRVLSSRLELIDKMHKQIVKASDWIDQELRDYDLLVKALEEAGYLTYKKKATSLKRKPSKPRPKSR